MTLSESDRSCAATILLWAGRATIVLYPATIPEEVFNTGTMQEIVMMVPTIGVWQLSTGLFLASIHYAPKGQADRYTEKNASL